MLSILQVGTAGKKLHIPDICSELPDDDCTRDIKLREKQT